MANPKLIIIIGVSGSGKTTLASRLAETLNWSFIEADEFHTADARDKMSRGIALNDSDREPWIDSIEKFLQEKFSQNRNLVLAYSGLKQTHRQRFRALGFQTVFLYLQARSAEIKRRLSSRQQHFFNAALLDSQFAAMESPQNESDIYPLDNSFAIEESLGLCLHKLVAAKILSQSLLTHKEKN